MADKRDYADRPQRSADRSDGEGEGLREVTGRKKRRRHPVLRALFRLLLVAALLLSILFVWKNWDAIAPEGMAAWLDETFAGGQKGDGFPMAISGGAVLDMEETSSGLAVLSDTTFSILNANGGEIVRRQHGFTAPILKTEGKWSLLAEIGGTRLRLETRAETEAEMELNNKLVSAAVNREGKFAVVTESSGGYASEVVVYSPKQKELVHWYSSDLTVLDVALSPDGKSMAAVGVAAQGGGMKASILLFDLSKKDPVLQVDDSDILLYAVDFFPNGTVAAIGDTALWIVNASGTIQQRHDYEGRELVGFAIGDEAVSVALKNYSGSEGGQLLTVNPSGDRAYMEEFEGTFRCLTPGDGGMLLLTGAHLYRTDAVGLGDTAEVARDGRLVGTIGRKVLVLGLTALSEAVFP